MCAVYVSDNTVPFSLDPTEHPNSKHNLPTITRNPISIAAAWVEMETKDSS